MGAAKIEIIRFLMMYLLLIIVILIMKFFKINKEKELLFSSLRMSLQLIIVGYMLTYLFKSQSKVYTGIYLSLMFTFTIIRILNKNKNINKKFKEGVFLSVIFSGLIVASYFVIVVLKENFFNPQYIVPIGGMLLGNLMNGVSLSLKTFYTLLKERKDEIDVLLNLGVNPKKIMFPFIKESLEMALIPTLNSMVGMGIISLPGMMTGQILSGTIPTTAILYQISIMLAICVAVCIACFIALYFGYRGCWNKEYQIKE